MMFFVVSCVFYLGFGMKFATFVCVMKKIFLLFTMIISSLAFFSCDEADEPTPVPEPEVKTVNRSVLVYMIADNSLGRAQLDRRDLLEMKAAAAKGDIQDGRLIVYHSAPGVNSGTVPVLLDVTSEGIDTLKSYPDNPEIYSVDVDRMKEVLADFKEMAPAREYGLVLWSHGSGWRENASSRSPKSRSFGEDRGVTMKVTSLADALAGEHFEFIYFDCCLMATVEVAYELRGVTDRIVASGTELMDTGMNYEDNVKVFFSSPLDIRQAAENTFNYYNGMTGVYRTCTMTVVNTSGLERLAAKARAIMATGAVPTIKLNQQQSYWNSASNTIFDLGYFVETLDCSDDLKADFNAALGDVVEYKAATPYILNVLRMSHYSGLGTFVMSSPADSTFYGYNNQSWYRDVVSFNPSYK